MTPEQQQIVVHLAVAMVAGGAIGLERSYHGRPAGFRTHVLVCMSSALLMLVTMYQHSWYPMSGDATVRVDPTRMAQGIMTGIGFLGAGVIMKDGVSIRGLTTAASIWITAGIGILAGIGFYFPLVVATVLTLAALSVFRWLENISPSYYYAHHYVRFPRDRAPDEAELRSTLTSNGFAIFNLSYRLDNEGKIFEYRMVIRSKERGNANRLARTWSGNSAVLEFRITPT